MPRDPYFRRLIRYYRDRQWWFVKMILTRRGLYERRLRQILRKQRMPWELVLLAGIESNYKPLEYSWAHAAGMWQFIAKTGLRYNMKRTPWKDERYNIDKATVAAASYLRDLQREFRNWPYAIAAYNCGEKCIRRVRRRCRGMSFWKARLRGCTLPRETRNYVARFFAVLYFLRNPAKRPEPISVKPVFALRKVRIRGVLSLPTIAEGLSVSMKEMREWNPELTSWATPPGTRYTMYVPPEHYKQMRRVLKRPSPTYRLKGMVVRSSVRMKRIARRYNLSVDFLRAINHLPEDAMYPEKRRLLVPLPRGARRWSARNSVHLARFASEVMPWSRALRRFRMKMLKLRPVRRRRVCYQVESGDSYWHIGRRYGVSHKTLWRINGKKRLHPGRWMRLATGARCPERQRFVPAWNRSLARKDWKQGYRLLHMYPSWGAKRLSRRKRRRKKRRRRLRRVSASDRGPRMSRRRCHRVRRGESFWRIAKRYKLRTKQLLHWNRKHRSMLRAGVLLKLHPRARCRR